VPQLARIALAHVSQTLVPLKSLREVGASSRHHVVVVAERPTQMIAGRSTGAGRHHPGLAHRAAHRAALGGRSPGLSRGHWPGPAPANVERLYIAAPPSSAWSTGAPRFSRPSRRRQRRVPTVNPNRDRLQEGRRSYLVTPSAAQSRSLWLGRRGGGRVLLRPVYDYDADETACRSASRSGAAPLEAQAAVGGVVRIRDWEDRSV
jgi:hypothetical protein